MKSLLFGTMLMLLGGLLLSASAFGGDQGIDPERVADEFVSLDIKQYECSFGFTRVLPEGGKQGVGGQFTLSLDGLIPYLVINGVEVVAWGDEPLGGLPVNKVGSATQFWLSLNAWDGTAGRHMAYGFMYDELLLPTDMINIVLYLTYQEEFVPFDASSYGVDPSQLFLRLNGSEFSYDSELGGFLVWYNPGTDGSYEIVNRLTGQVIARGSIADGLAEANIVNVSMVGGVRELIPVGQDSVYWLDQWPSSPIERDGQVLPAQVYTVRVYGGQLSLELSGFSSGTIEVYSVDSGERVLVAVSEAVAGFYNYLQVPIGYDRLVVEIIYPDWNNLNLFHLWAYRSGGGYGKG